MSEIFSCPSCTGRLTYEEGGGPTVRCPYCNNTVIVPEHLWRRGEADAGNIDELDAILAAVEGGRKIEAIKLYRETYDVELTEAKAAVEHLLDGYAVQAESSGRGGCIISLLVLILIGAGLFFVLPLDEMLRDVEQAVFTPTPSEAVARGQAIVTQVSAGQENQPVTLRFGTRGISPGQFNDPRSLTFTADGDLLVADYAGGRIQRFDAEGAFKEQWELDPEKFLMDIDADRAGNLYVLQSSDLFRYDLATGEQLATLDYQGESLVSFIDMAVGDDGHVVGVNFFGELVRFDENGEPLWIIPEDDIPNLTNLNKVALDGAGNTYLLATYEDALRDRHEGVFVFDRDGALLTRFGESGDALGNFRSPRAIAVDGQGRIYVADFPGILVFNNSGAYQETLGTEGAIFGLAVADDGALWATGNANEVVRYAPLGD